jgi:hypothetical protein
MLAIDLLETIDDKRQIGPGYAEVNKSPYKPSERKRGKKDVYLRLLRLNLVRLAPQVAPRRRNRRSRGRGRRCRGRRPAENGCRILGRRIAVKVLVHLLNPSTAPPDDLMKITASGNEIDGAKFDFEEMAS